MIEAVLKFKKRNLEKRLRVAVVGDTLIDEYRYGTVRRISPEFPVPVLSSERDVGERLPGGAANVCHQMRHMNVDAFLVGFVDERAAVLYSEFKFDVRHCVKLTSGAVPVKVRFYEGDFPLLRWDIEAPDYGEPEIKELRKKALRHLEVLLKVGLDAVIASDYAKGFFSEEAAVELVGLCKKYGVALVVDPKKGPLSKWAGASVIKPNASEAEALTGRKEVERQLEELCGVAGVGVITQGGSGVVVRAVGGAFEYKSSVMRQFEGVNYVVGAGDCFIAVLTLGLSYGLTTQEAVAVAFEAGAVYVRVKHNRPIRPNDILALVDLEKSKICSPEELSFSEGEKIVWVNGCFDLGLTRGHIECLKFAKSQGDKLVVGVNSDESVRRLKGEERPVMSLDERTHILASLSFVDYVVSFDEDTPLEVIEKVRPHVVVKGGDYKPEDVVGNHLAEVRIAPFFPGCSTTSKINKILNG